MSTPTAPLPSTMRAAVYVKKRWVQVEERPLPELGPDDVLLRVSHCGVCGTDLHLVMEGWGRPNSIGGHEYSGEVAAVGSSIRDWQIGEGAVGGPEPGCGRCAYCAAGRPGLCAEHANPGLGDFQGAFAEYKSVRADQLLRTPEGLSLRNAAIAEPLAVSLHGITASGIRAGQRALVTGAGPIGLFTLAALRARGIDDVTVSEPSPVRRERAARVGAARVITPEELESPRMPFEIIVDPVDAAFECSGNPEAVQSALAQLDKTGVLVLVGTGMQKPRLDANRVLLNELTITGAYNYDDNGVADALELLASERLPTDLLIEPGDVGLDGLLEAMERLERGRIGGKVLVNPN